MSKRLKIGITQGDTNGVGWEVILKIFSDNRLAELFTPVIYGSSAAAAFYQKRLNDLEPVKFVVVDGAERAQQGRVNLVECGAKELSVTPGKPSKAGGEAAAVLLRLPVWNVLLFLCTIRGCSPAISGSPVFLCLYQKIFRSRFRRVWRSSWVLSCHCPRFEAVSDIL